MKILHIVGARPQFIKLAPLCRAIKERKNISTNNLPVQSLIVHTGQHYDYLMSKVFFDDLHIPEPDYNLEVGSGKHGQQTGLMLARLEEVLLKESPYIVIVYGDTNSTLAGALAAAKLHIPIAHVEAGLRSYNRRMPEEINRVLTDHVSTILFCPTRTSVLNLEKEGFTNIFNAGELVDFTEADTGAEKLLAKSPMVINVGDVMYDSTIFSLQIAMKKSTILQRLSLEQPAVKITPYALCTIHRQENTDDQQRLKVIMEALEEIARNGMKVIIPLHPRTKGVLEILGARLDNLSIIDPVSYYDMLILQDNANIVITDSGGVQKEAFFLQTPCITLRDETEWIETMEAGMNIIAGIKKRDILVAYKKHVQNLHTSDTYKTQHTAPGNPKAQNTPFGNANAASLILKVIVDQ